MVKTNTKHQIVFGSDIDRDGVFLELSRLEPDGSHPIVEIFRSDRDGSITLTSEPEPIPPDLIASLLDRVRTDLLQRPLGGESRE